MSHSKQAAAPSARRRGMRLAGLGIRTASRMTLQKLRRSDDADVNSRLLKVGEDWLNTLGDMKGAAMKFGQFASQFADMLPTELAEPLSRLQGDVEPMPLAALESVLETAWGANWQQRFSRFEPVAMAAASIGQVHSATLNDGREVVVKIRYPGIEAACDSDIRGLRRLIRMGRILDVPKADLDAIFIEIRDRLREEMDFARELHNLEQLAAQKVPGMVVPRPVKSMCSDSLLVLEHEGGLSLEAARELPQQQRDELGATLVRNLLHQVLVSGWVHGDPNPGNFAFRPATEESGQMSVEVVQYDYGCVKQLPVGLSEGLRKALLAYAQQDWSTTHAALFELGGVSKPDWQPDDIYALWWDVTLGRFLRERPFDFADPSIHDEAVKAVRKSFSQRKAFRPIADMVFVNRTFSGMYWLLRRLGARVDLAALLAEVEPNIEPLLSAEK